jgi:PAS domain S-box-containing protein
MTLKTTCVYHGMDCPHQLECLTRQLAEREERLIEFWQRSIDIHCILSDGVIEYISGACESILGTPPEEMEGKLFIDFLHSDDIVKTISTLEAVSQEQIPAEFKTRYQHAQGHYVTLSWRISPPIDNRVCCSARVITQPEKTVTLRAFSTPLAETHTQQATTHAAQRARAS